jgi:hypothetical protein
MRWLLPPLPWFVAIIVSVLAGAAVVLLLLDPDKLPLPLGLLTVAVVLVYGTEAVRAWRKCGSPSKGE